MANLSPPIIGNRESATMPGPFNRQVTMESLAPSTSHVQMAESLTQIPQGYSALSPEALGPSVISRSDPPPYINEAGIREFFHAKTIGGSIQRGTSDLSLKPSASLQKTSKNALAPPRTNSSMQRKKTRPSAFEKMPDKDKTDAYFRLQEENMQLKKDHTELEHSIRLLKSNLSKLEKGVKQERELAESYTGKDFKSSMIESGLNADSLKAENKMLLQENKILIKAALTGNLNKQLLSRIEGPALNKFDMRPRVLSGAVMFDIKREHSPRNREPTPVQINYQEEKVDVYKIEYDRLMADYLELQKLFKAEQEKNINLESRIRAQTPDGSRELYELREKCKMLERQLAESLQSPFLKEDSGLKRLQSEMLNVKEKGLKADSIIIQLQEQIKILAIERDKYKDDFLILQARVSVKDNYMKEFETQLRMIGGMDLNAFMKALGLMKLKGDEPAWSQLDFLEQGTVIPNDLNGLKREIERLKLEKGQLAAEVEKAQSLLVLKNEMEREKSMLYESEIEQLKIQMRSAQQRTEELARLADYRANRVIQLERNQRLNVYDEDNRIVASKTQITIGELNNAAAEFVESGTEVTHNENILDLWLGQAEYYQSALENTLRGQVSLSGTFLSFLTVDFYNMETQSTSLCESLNPKYNIHISFKVTVSDIFIKTLETGYIYLEGHASKGDSHVTFSRCQIPLKELLVRSSAISDLNTKTGVVESMATYLSNFDGKTSVGTQMFKIRMRYPLSEAMRWYREKEEIVELANPKQFALDTIYTYSGPTKTRELVISIFRCMGLKGQAYPGNMRPFVYFQFFTEPETYTNLAIGPDPVYDQTFRHTLLTSPDLKRYLDLETLEIVVFDDNAPIREGGQDIIGTAKIPLSALLLDTAIEGTYMLYNFRGVDSGKISIRLAWRDSKADQVGYGTPLTQAWEKEVYERIAKSLSSRGLGIESGFNIFDQDQDGLISPQEFRNTILITLRLPLSEQEIQLLINTCNLVEGGITKTLFRQKFAGLLASDRAIEPEESWEDTIIEKVRQRIEEKGLSVVQAFSAFDENKDGIISSGEFVKTFKVMALGLSDIEIERLLRYFDPQRNGRIDYRMFVERINSSRHSEAKSWEDSVIEKVRKRIQEKNLSIEDAFSAFDENKDGIISAAEFIKTFRVMELGLSDSEISRLLNYFDERNTGKIDYRVFVERINSSRRSEEKSWEFTVIEKVRKRIQEKNLSVREAFSAFDENKDGMISAAEFIKTFRVMQLGLSDAEISRLLTHFDEKRSGFIDYRIFCDRLTDTIDSGSGSWEQKIISLVRKRIQEKGLSISQAFLAFDENKDGQISSNEFIKTFKIMDLGLSEEDIRRLFTHFDTKRSGVIDYRIFCDRINENPHSSPSRVSWEDNILDLVRKRIREKGLSLKQGFESFDQNKDGKISAIEFLKTFRIMELGIPDDDINRLFVFFDPRRTGFIDYRAFCDKISDAPQPSASSIGSWEENILEQVRKRIREKGLSLRQSFLAFDENKDGKISNAEFVKTFRVMDLGLSDRDINRLFAFFDQKNTGIIDYQVFCDKISDTPQASPASTGNWQENILAQVRKRIKEKGLSIRESFAAFDENKDGQISSAEFVKTFRIMDLGLNENDISRLFAYFDVKKTGVIDYRVFCDKISETPQPSPASTGNWQENILAQVRKRIKEKGLSIRESFAAFDENKDGQISSAEFVKTFRIMDLGLNENDISRLFAYFDVKKTGSIDYRVFCDKISDVPQPVVSTGSWEDNIIQQVKRRIQEKGLSIRQSFEAFDQNRDGKISAAEFLKTFRVMELGLADEDINRLFGFFDPYRTGSIDYRLFSDKISDSSRSASDKIDPSKSGRFASSSRFK